MKTLFCICSIFICTSLKAQEIAIVPKPVKTDWKKGNFTINKKTVLVISSSEEKKSADFLNSYLEQFYGFKLTIGKKPVSDFISLSAKHTYTSVIHGRYTFIVSPASVNINGDNEEGVFYGVQTLIQLLPADKSGELKIPAVSIEDFPRFAYRGLMLDRGRHFFSVGFVKKYIDYIALHKLNYFHWHLTDDQGWRIEIKKYPKLTEVGSCRNCTIVGHHPGTGNDNEKQCGYYEKKLKK